MFDEVMSTYGGIDILINNAGIQIAGDSDQLSVDDFDGRGSSCAIRTCLRVSTDQCGYVDRLG